MTKVRWLDAHLEFCDEDVRDAADDGDEVKNVPPISEIVLQEEREKI